MNASLSGGLVWFYRDQPELADDRVHNVYCMIDSGPVVVTEARFGGIVGQPLIYPLDTDICDFAVWLISEGPALYEARARLKSFQRTQ